MLGTMADEEIDAEIFAQAVQRYMEMNSRKLLHYPTKANGEMRNCVNTNLLFTTQITVKTTDQSTLLSGLSSGFSR